MEPVKSNNERELTSTMGNVLSTSSKDEKNDTSDATPTSSTDANTTSTASQIVSDDPISSTSSDIVEQNKSKTTEVNMQNSVEISQSASDEPDKSTSADHDADLLEMSISNVPNEKITEDVEDLVHDLESLLGEPTDSFNVPVKRKEDRKSPEAKEIVDQPLDLPGISAVTDEVLSSGDPMSSKNNVEQKNLDTSKDENSEEKSFANTLPAEIQEIKIPEDKPEQGDRSDKDIIEEDEKNKTSTEESVLVTNTGEVQPCIGVSNEPLPSSECHTTEEVKTKEKCDIGTEENKDQHELVPGNIVDSVEVQEDLKDIKAKVPTTEDLENATENPVEETQGKVEEECKVEEVTNEPLQERECKESEPVAQAEINEEKVEKQEMEVNKEDNKSEEPKEAASENVECMESTTVPESIENPIVKEDKEPVQEDAERKIDLKEIVESKIETTTKDKVMEDLIVNKHEEVVQPLVEAEVFNVSVVHDGPSGDTDLKEKIADTENIEDNQDKVNSGDLKTENTEDSNKCIDTPQLCKESLKDCDPQQQEEETIEESDAIEEQKPTLEVCQETSDTKDKGQEEHLKEEEVKEDTAAIVDAQRSEEMEGKQIEEENKIRIEMEEEEVKEDTAAIVDAQRSEEMESKQIEEENKIRIEMVSNAEEKEDVAVHSEDVSEQISEPVNEETKDPNITPQEEVKPVLSPKTEESDIINANKSESQNDIPEPTEDVAPEKDVTESEIMETVSEAQISTVPNEEVSDLQTNVVDSKIPTQPEAPQSVTLEETITFEEVATISDNVIVEDDADVIVSEPEQVKESTAEVPQDSKVDIVEIIEGIPEKTSPVEEIVEGEVIDEFGKEKTIGIVTEIPEIVIDPPADSESKERAAVPKENLPSEVQPEEADVSIETLQSQVQAEESDVLKENTQSELQFEEADVSMAEEQPKPVTDSATEHIVNESQEQTPVESISDEKPVEPVESSQETPTVEEINSEVAQDEVVLESEMKSEDKIESDVKVSKSDIVESETSEPLEETANKIEEKLKANDEIEKVVDDTVTVSDNLPVETDAIIEAEIPTVSEEIQKAADESTDVSEEISQPKEEISGPINPPVISTESTGPVDLAPYPSDDNSEMVDDPPSIVDDAVSQIDSDDKPIDEGPIAVEASCTNKAIEVPIDETPTVSDETPVPIEETSNPKPDTAETVTKVNETPIPDEVSELVKEIPSSSDEISVLNNAAPPSDDVSIAPVKAPVSGDETPEQIDESSKVVLVEESSDSMEETSKNEVPKPENESIEIQMKNSILEAQEDIQLDQDAVELPAPESSKETEVTEVQEDNNKIIEISDDDSKPMESGEGDYVQVLSSEGDSDSEEMVPVLALEPDENNPSPKEPIGAKDDSETERSTMVHSMDVASVTEPLPEIEDILADQAQVDEVAASIDMQENLETILAVASLQNSDSAEVDTTVDSVEPQISEKERREMEALRKAVESITENPAVELEEEVETVVEEIIKDADIPVEDNLVEPVTIQEPDESLVLDVPKDKTEVVISKDEVITIEEVEDNVEKVEQTESDTDQDVPELRIEDSEDTQDVEENAIESKEDVGDEQAPQSLPDTSQSMENERKDVLPDSSQVVLVNEEVKQSAAPKETKSKSNERPRRHKKSISDNKFEELSINVDVPDREKPYSPKVTIKPIKVPDDEVSTTSNSDSEVGKGCLKMTITKQSDKMHSILKICDPETSEQTQEPDEPIPKLIIKPKMQQVEQQHSPKMSTRSSKQMYSPTSSTQRSGSPRITIKPVVKPEKVESVSPLKIKIKPDDNIKKHNTKLNIKPVAKPEDETNIQTARKVIIKPVVKPVDEPEQVHSPRITIKPILKPESEKESVSTTPRLNIKPIKKQDDEEIEVEKERSSPKITIKPIIKPQEPDTQTSVEEEEVKERIVLKINKGTIPTPTKDPKKREHPPDEDKSEKLAKITVKFSKGGGHPHIVQQSDESNKRAHEEQLTPEKTKKQKTDGESAMSTRSKHKDNVDSPVETRSKHKESTSDNSSSDTKSKQKEEFMNQESSKSKHKEPITESPIEAKRAKLKETPSESPRSRHKDVSESSISEATRSKHKEHIIDKVEAAAENPENVRIESKMDSPIVISEDSRSQDSGSCIIVEDSMKDPLAAIPVFEIRAEQKTPNQELASSALSTPSVPTTPTPRKRGRPRKVPIVVREEFKEQEEPKPDAPKEEQKPAQESGRPKRSCRGQSVRATLGIKPRKPRGPGRGRGSKRGMGTRAVPMKPEGEPKLSKAKLKLMQESIKEQLTAKPEVVDHEKKPVLQCLLSNIEIKAPAPVLAPPETSLIEVPASPSSSLPVPSPQAPVASPTPAPAVSPKPVQPTIQLSATGENSATDSATPSTSTRVSGEIVMVDEETRMSADTNSRAQTPAKQVPADVVIEESQSSVQSTATTESGKAASSRPNKAPRLEVQEPEGAVISADQLTEYYWNGNGPFMLQEQVAQFLGIKSFKRKYPGIMRRMLDMQERDFIRESGLASEHMCDLGLTAVNSADILDIMYSDFQEKYEEYCKHQRDRQAKDLINKQKALSLAASQEKNKADITEQAVQSAAQWNATFNKARKEQRKACMDLQTLTVHYPRGKMKQINKTKVGNYPVALVPGQFTDYYKEFTPTEINNLPINTMCYDPINIIPPEESEDSGSDGSESDSDSSSSSSGSGSDSSSGVEDCKLCKHTPKKVAPSK